MKALPRGFIPVMLTPFHDDLSVDFETLRSLCDYYIEQGAVGLFANCLSSEMYELTDEERLAVIKTVVDHVAGRVSVVATGTFGGNMEEMASFSNQVYALGVDAVIILNNQFVTAEESDEVFLARMRRWMELTPGVPFGIYECPVPYKRLVSIPVLMELLASGRLCYHKDTSLNIEQVKGKIQAGTGLHFGVYDAYMVHAKASLEAGSMGLSCIQGNFFPDLLADFCVRPSDGFQTFLTENMELMHSAYPTSAKYVLQKQGFPISLATRRKVDPLTQELMSKFDALITSASLYRSP
jgi:4-hydroxy-tetrahydrodipicolinate synthase